MLIRHVTEYALQNEEAEQDDRNPGTTRRTPHPIKPVNLHSCWVGAAMQVLLPTVTQLRRQGRAHERDQCTTALFWPHTLRCRREPEHSFSGCRGFVKKTCFSRHAPCSVSEDLRVALPEAVLPVSLPEDLD